MVLAIKDGTISEEEYAKQYRELIRSYMTNQIYGTI